MVVHFQKTSHISIFGMSPAWPQSFILSRCCQMRIGSNAVWNSRTYVDGRGRCVCVSFLAPHCAAAAEPRREAHGCLGGAGGLRPRLPAASRGLGEDASIRNRRARPGPPPPRGTVSF